MTTSYLQRLRLIRRDVWLVSTLLFTHMFVLYGVYVVAFNLYLLRLDYGPQFIGLVNAVMLFGFALLAALVGAFARRWNRWRMMTGGKAIETIGMFLIALAEVVPAPWRSAWILALYALVALGGALWYVNYNPFLLSATGPEEREQAFAVSTALNPLGTLVGSLIGGMLPGLFAALLGSTLADPAPYRYTLLAGSLLNVAGVAAMFGVRDVQPQQESAGPARSGGFPLASVGPASLVYLLIAAGVGSVSVFTNVYLDAYLKVSTALIGFVMAGAALVSIAAIFIMPMLVACWGRVSTISGAILVLVLGIVLAALVPHWVAMGASRIILSCAYWVMYAVLAMYSLELVRPEWRATMSGATSLALGLGRGAASFAGGYIIAGWGYAALFAMGAAFALAGGALFWGYFRAPRGELRGAAAAAGGK